MIINLFKPSNLLSIFTIAQVHRSPISNRFSFQVLIDINFLIYGHVEAVSLSIYTTNQSVITESVWL